MSDKKKFQPVLEEAPSLLPPEELRGFVASYFNKRHTYLALLEQEPAPLYILDSSVLKERARQFQEAFRKVLPQVAFYYAVKSNNHLDVSRILLEAGFGLDVSSGLELEMALALGARDIVFSGPGKTEGELRLAALNAEKTTVLIDSFGELLRLEEAASAHNTTVRAGVRLTTNPMGLWRKFGIVAKDLPTFWEAAQKFPHIRLEGLQFHSSWNLSPDAQMAFIRTLGVVLSHMPSPFKKSLKFIDIGGGYWPPQGEWLQPAGTPAGILQKALGKEPGPAENHYRVTASPIETFAHELGPAIRNHLLSAADSDCRICFEPGRWICNDAMHLLLSVVDKKAPDLVVTDAGTNAVGWERFETDYFPVLNLTRPALEEKRCHILGSLCTPHDVWGYTYWGDDIQPGDILMIPTQGAYTYSLRQHFIKPLPRVVTI